MLGNPVAVEKLGFPKKSRKSGDTKCPGDSGKLFVELPDAKQFLRNRSERVFQQPLLLPPPISKCDISVGDRVNFGDLRRGLRELGRPTDSTRILTLTRQGTRGTAR